jgi:hypothetical protein
MLHSHDRSEEYGDRVEAAARGAFSWPAASEPGDAAGSPVFEGREDALLHRLLWSPGAMMHPDWWRQLQLDAWRQAYLDFPGSRAALDSIIVARRGLPMPPGVARCTPLGARLLSLDASRMRQLLGATGIVCLGQGAWLVHGRHRDALAELLPEPAGSQLLALCAASGRLDDGATSPQSMRDEICGASDVCAEAIAAGCAWLDHQYADDIGWQGASWLVPPARRAIAPPRESLAVWLHRLERFLWA